jgi:hypothetical protein
MLHRVALVRTDVSDERNASIITETKISELGMLAVTSNQSMLGLNTMSERKQILMKEEICSSETSVLTTAIQYNILEDAILHSHNRENLKSYIALTGWTL